jgi:hypothetical protein
MQAKQVEESPFFIGQRKSGTRVWHKIYIFYKPTKNQSTLTLFNQAPQNVETKIEFPRSEFHRQMANKKKKDIFETLSVPLLDDIKLKSQIKQKSQNFASKFEIFHIINRHLE